MDEQPGTDRDEREDDGGGGTVAVGVRVNDFELVRLIVAEEMSEEGLAALDRIEAWTKSLVEDVVIERAEVERLREAEEICLKYHNARAKVMQENERLRAENTELRKAFESDEYAIEQAREVGRLRAALEFYADERLWYNGVAPKGPAIRDRGNRARNALAEEKV
jgi:hypothetical protein